MTHNIEVTNVNQALSEGLTYLYHCGEEETSRNGSVLVAPGPVMTTYLTPWRRVLMSPKRNANPFFHFFESLWMLNGQRDLAWLVKFNSKYVNYSDDGVLVHGAYGARWRNWFGFDQLIPLLEELRTNPNTRRAVLTMWDPNSDLVKTEDGRGGMQSKDLCCNTHIYFDRRNGALNMTVCNRSNDIVWGAYGANVVHFSFLQEYLAAVLESPVGVYRQFSNNYHLYLDTFNRAGIPDLAIDADIHDPYRSGHRPHFPLMVNPVAWEAELVKFMLRPEVSEGGYTEPFFVEVACPMLAAWESHKAKNPYDALRAANEIDAWDWRQACVEWLERRSAK